MLLFLSPGPFVGNNDALGLQERDEKETDTFSAGKPISRSCIFRYARLHAIP